MLSIVTLKKKYVIKKHSIMYNIVNKYMNLIYKK